MTFDPRINQLELRTQAQSAIIKELSKACLELKARVEVLEERNPPRTELELEDATRAMARPSLSGSLDFWRAK